MIARSRAINALKKKRPTLLAELPEQETPFSDPEHREDFQALDLALHRLPPKQKRAFTLIALEELTYAEAAQIEATSVGTIKSRVSRAREFLKLSLKPT